MEVGTLDAVVDEMLPLVVDLDGTLIRSDLLIESFLAATAADFRVAAKVPLWLLAGRAALKQRLAEVGAIDYATLPYNEAVLDYLKVQKALGRPLYLASASDRAHVEEVAAHLGLFDGVFASNGEVNLKASAKAEMLCREFGDGGFDYIGNSADDLAVWEKARRAITVDLPKRLHARLEARPFHDLCSIPAGLGDYLRQLRPHQWSKNVLVFMAVLAAHQLTAPALLAALGAFVAFCLCASGIYIVNDLLDLPHDRIHPTKRRRPLASGRVPLAHGAAMAVGLLAGAASVTALLNAGFAALLGLYLCLTLAYSLVLKRHVMVDVVALGILYTLRVLAGAVAVGVPVSPWLLGFSLFLFLSLALIKRYSELNDRRAVGETIASGRGYAVSDLPVLAALAAASGYSAIVVLAVYIGSPAVELLYARPEYLWGLCVLLVYWFSRVLILSHRGQIHEDPIVFAFRDRVSLFVLLAGIAVVTASVF